ncbi:hypothetical protein [Phormidesmis priestleyi]
MKIITFASSFRRAYKAMIRKRPDLQPKIENILEIQGHPCSSRL